MVTDPPKFAAIDLGSNGIRLSIAQPDTSNASAAYSIIHHDRKPVRLGIDAFNSGILSNNTITESINALKQFRAHLNQHQVKTYRAVATSAARASSNIHQLIDQAQNEAHIHLEIITDQQEAQLLFQAIQAHHQLSEDAVTIIIDMGGGSVEIILAQPHEHSEINTASFPIGPIRILQQFKTSHLQLDQIQKILQPAAQNIQDWIHQQSLNQPLANTAYAVGGNIEALGKCRQHLLGKSKSRQLKFNDLETIIPLLRQMTLEEKITKCHWRIDRADTIDIAAATLLMVMQSTRIKKLIIPKLSIRDGILTQLLAQSLPASEEPPQT